MQAVRRGPPSDRYMELVYHRIHSRQRTPIYKCHLCNKSEIKGDLAAHKHINNSKHLTKLDSIPAEFKVRNNNSHAHSESILVSTPGCPVLHCTVCNEDLLGREAVLKHLESQRHASNAQASQHAGKRLVDCIHPTQFPGLLQCEVCDQKFEDNEVLIVKHAFGGDHMKKQLRWYRITSG
ncbi:hypothetical protein AAVH_38245, partial [Aphelenchoides avenae]